MASNLKPLVLHAHMGGPNPFKVAIVLEHLSIPYEVKVWNFGDDPKSGVKGKDFLAINENGRVPALEDPNTGVTSWESLACVNYLLRVYDKQNKLGPGDSEQDKVDFDKWIALLVSTLGPMLGQLNWYKHYNATSNPDALERYKQQSYRCFGVFEGLLQNSTNGFVLPKGFTAVDIHYYPWVKSYAFAGLTMDDYPKTAQWIQKCADMKEVQAAYEKIPKGQKM